MEKEPMMTESLPAFQEAPRCDVCSCSFSTFRRRHHCRCCGRTLCSDHSSKQMPLPQFGIYLNVRVCDDCYNNPSRSGKDGQGTSNTVSAVIDEVSKLNTDEDDVPEAKSTSWNPVASVFECRCGMPLCICKPPTADPMPSQNSTVSSVQSNPRPKKPSSAQEAAKYISRKPSSSSSKTSSFLNMGEASNGNVDKPKADYDVSGEGLREAIKSSDPVAVRKLLIEGVDANFCDKNGLTLLHLAWPIFHNGWKLNPYIFSNINRCSLYDSFRKAALFNQTEIAFILMDHGASVEQKNAQGETPLDCAPTMLQYKMRQKMDNDMAKPQPDITP